MNSKSLKRNSRPFLAVFLVLSFSICLTSCDPMKSVLISNQTKENVSVLIVQDSGNPLPLGPEAETEITLAADGDSSETRVIYGLGVFSKEELASFNSSITAIQVETDTDTCRVSGKELRPFLPKRRLGMFNNTIEIKIRNCPSGTY